MILGRGKEDEAEAAHSMHIQFDDKLDRTEMRAKRHRAADPMAERIADLARALVDAQRERKAWSSGRSVAKDPKAEMTNPFRRGSVEHQAFKEGVAYERTLQFQKADW